MIRNRHRKTCALEGRRALAAASFALALASGRAGAEAATREVTTQKARIVLSDVLPACPQKACSADLGAAPPPGSSRLIGVRSLRAAVAAAGEDPKALGSLTPVRVTSSAKRLNPAEVVAFARASVERALSPGVSLVSIAAKSSLVAPELAAAGDCSLPALPRRAGRVAVTGLLDVLHEGVVVRRVPLLLQLSQSESAAQPDLKKGHELTLVIERRSVTIGARAVALEDTDVGQVAAFRVQRTGRILHARLQSSDVAVVVEQR